MGLFWAEARVRCQLPHTSRCHSVKPSGACVVSGSCGDDARGQGAPVPLFLPAATSFLCTLGQHTGLSGKRVPGQEQARCQLPSGVGRDRGASPPDGALLPEPERPERFRGKCGATCGLTAALLPLQARSPPLGSALRESTPPATPTATAAKTPRAPSPSARRGADPAPQRVTSGLASAPSNPPGACVLCPSLQGRQVWEDPVPRGCQSAGHRHQRRLHRNEHPPAGRGPRPVPWDPRVPGRRHAGPGAGAGRHQVRGRKGKSPECDAASSP